MASLSKIAKTHQNQILLSILDINHVYYRSHCIILSLLKSFKKPLFLSLSNAIYLYLGQRFV